MHPMYICSCPGTGRSLRYFITNAVFYVLYEKRPVMGKFKKPVFDEVSKCYRIQWSDMAYLTESIVVDKMYVSPKD